MRGKPGGPGGSLRLDQELLRKRTARMSTEPIVAPKSSTECSCAVEMLVLDKIEGMKLMSMRSECRIQDWALVEAYLLMCSHP